MGNNEPSHFRKPVAMSEPGIRRKPKCKSEFRMVGNPMGNSEPREKRNLVKASEPHNRSKPSSGSEPNERRKPGGVSEPIDERKPRLKSERNPRFISAKTLPEEVKKRIRILVGVYYDVQDVRTRSFNRLRTVGVVEGVDPKHLRRLEREIRRYIGRQIEGVPIYENFLKRIYGLGPILSGALISYLDPHKADHPSSFWRYMGLHVVNGRAVRLEKGKKIDFNKKLRPIYWKLGMQFIKFKTPPYYQIYEDARERETEKLGDPLKDPRNCPRYNECISRLRAKSRRTGKPMKNPPCKLHIHLRAMRKAVKRFLTDLWLKWREIEGLPISLPYAIEVLGHKPDKYSLPELKYQGSQTAIGTQKE